MSKLKSGARNAPPLQAIFQHAENLRCFATLSRDEKGYRIDTLLDFPSQIVESLALELYLKASLVAEGRWKQAVGHDHHKLFGKLSDQSQSSIIEEFERQPYKQWREDGAREAATEFLRQSPNFDFANFFEKHNNFRKRLWASKDSFERVRYLYEKIENIEHVFNADHVTEAVRAFLVESYPALIPLMVGPSRENRPIKIRIFTR
jgi:hypothetical protein